MGTSQIVNAITAALVGGAVFWALTWSMSRASAWLRFRGAFPDLVLNAPGERARRELELTESNLQRLAAAALAAIVMFPLCLFLGSDRFSGWLMWTLFGVSCLFVVGWGYFLVRAVLDWREKRFAVRAVAAMGAVFSRLAGQRHRVFHEVPLNGEVMDHVVVGPRGAFAIRVVSRRTRKEATRVRLSNRFVEFQDNLALPEPVVSAERGARGLAELSGKILSHKIRVRPIVALPGWEIDPAQAPVSDAVLVNEKSALMLLSLSTPADHLFEEDAAKLQEELAKMSRNPAL